MAKFIIRFSEKASGKRLTLGERDRMEWYSGDYDDGFDPEFLDLDACADAADALNDWFFSPPHLIATAVHVSPILSNKRK